MVRIGSSALAALIALSGLLLGTAAIAAPMAPVAAADAFGSGEAATDLATPVRHWLDEHPLAAVAGRRVELAVGAPDARLRLAACRQVQVALPPGMRLWGKTRLAVHCEDGPTHWTVHVPVTVKVWAQGTVARSALTAGSVLAAGDLAVGDVDLAEDAGTAWPADAAGLVGRTLQRPVAAGQGLRSTYLKPHIWFSAGDLVKVLAAGDGFAVSGEGVAMTAGVEGQPVRVRTEGGRVVIGNPTAERLVELPL